MRTGRMLTVLFLAQLTLASLSAAVDPPDPAPPVDVVTVLDISGSMKKNDPQLLLREVVSSFASRLAPDSRLGIVLFAETAEVTLGLTAANAPDFTAQVAKSLERIDYRGRRTDIPAGVERALYELRTHGRPAAQRLIILLTDGLVDVGNPAKDVERARWLREDLALQAQQSGIRIFGIALSEGADFQLMQSVAQTTGGEYFRVLAAADIPGTFEKISARIDEMIRAAQRAAEAKPAETTAPPTPVVVQVPVTTPGWQQPWVLPTVVGLIVLGIVALTVTRGTKRATMKVDVLPATLYDRSGRSGKERYPMRKPVLRIGRDAKTNDVVIPEETVSSLHAVIEFRAGAFYLQDLRSTNGTFVNGKQVSDSETIRETPLKNQDRVRFDAYEFEFIIDALDKAGQTVVAGGTPAGGTRLRSPEPPRPQVDEEAADGSVPVEGTPGSGDGEAPTKLKSDMCPHHASLKATELCLVCGKAYCQVFCMKEKDGHVLCPEGHAQQ
jgi:von Willebrand factor type A domain/FHA domain